MSQSGFQPTGFQPGPQNAQQYSDTASYASQQLPFSQPDQSQPIYYAPPAPQAAKSSAPLWTAIVLLGFVSVFQFFQIQSMGEQIKQSANVGRIERLEGRFLSADAEMASLKQEVAQLKVDLSKAIQSPDKVLTQNLMNLLNQAKTQGGGWISQGLQQNNQNPQANTQNQKENQKQNDWLGPLLQSWLQSIMP
jgi:hypothetical protein